MPAANRKGPREIAAMTRWMALLTAVALCGCGGFGFNKPANDPTAEPNIFPANYKTDMLSFLQTYLIDPTGIRDAALAPPVLKPFGTQSRYVVCVRYNARDGDKKYLGGTEKVAIYFGGKFNQFVDATPELCGGAPYQAFPELLALKRVNDR
jgi:hypothetical protein